MFFRKIIRVKGIFNSKNFSWVLVFLLIFNFSKASDIAIETEEKIEVIENQEEVETEKKIETAKNNSIEATIIEDNKTDPTSAEAIADKKTDNEKDKENLAETTNNQVKIILDESDISTDEKQKQNNENDEINQGTDQKSGGDEGSEENKRENEIVENNEEINKCNINDRPGLEDILISEIFPFPLKNSEEKDWFELYNSGNEVVDLEGCFLVDGRYNPDEKNLEKCFKIKDGVEIEKGQFLVFDRSDFKFDINNKSSDGIYFVDSDGEIIDETFYKGGAQEGFSYALDSSGNWKWTEFLTPGEINKFPEPKNYSKKLEITEILPNPEGVDKNKEWLELFNGDLLEIDLSGWFLINQSNQKFKLDGLKIKSQKRLKVEIKNSSFSIKNSDGWIELRNPNEEKVDKVVYIESAKINASYNKKTTNQWEWSVFITPGQENKFNDLPTYSVDIPDKIYENVKAFFEIEKVKDKDGEGLKFRWDFGDGKKSYLKETNHKFDKRGRYTIQTRVSDLSADVFKYFNIEVEKFPDFDLEIVKLLPNPEGSDSENEKIWILNKEKKEINLKGWSITTGSSMNKLTNHYFKEDFEIKAGDIKEVDREDCPFSLLNKKGRVVLKAPNGEVVDKVKYQKDKIEEDEIYYLEDGNWFWQLLIKETNQQKKSSGAMVLGEENQSSKKDLIRLILDENKYYGSKKLVYFNNWLFIQSQNYFFEFIFPENLVERIKT